MARRNSRPTEADQRFGLLPALIMVLVAGFGAFLLVSALILWHDHRVLASRGLTATAVITKVHEAKEGSFVDVRFTTATGQQIAARLEDPPGGLHQGGTIAVRYDPLDADGRIEPASDGIATATRWFLLVTGVLLLVLVGHRAGRSGRQAVRR